VPGANAPRLGSIGGGTNGGKGPEPVPVSRPSGCCDARTASWYTCGVERAKLPAPVAPAPPKPAVLDIRTPNLAARIAVEGRASLPSGRPLNNSRSPPTAEPRT